MRITNEDTNECQTPPASRANSPGARSEVDASADLATASADSATAETFGKWLKVNPQSTAREVALAALSNRLMRISPLLEQATQHGTPNPETISPENPSSSQPNAKDRDDVRRLRVATRRATIAANLFGEFASPATTAQILRDLKKIRKAAGRVRDLDVLIDNTRARDPNSPNLAPLELQRAVAQTKIDKSYQKYIASGRLKEGIRQLLESLTPSDTGQPAQPFSVWAHATLTSSGTAFFSVWPATNTSGTEEFLALHNFRLQVKRMRYRVELLGPAVAKKSRKKFNRSLKKLQTSLGEINDHDAAIQKLQRWLINAEPEKQSRLNRQLEHEQIARTEAVTRFREKWSDEKRDKLKATFSQLVCQN